MSFAARHSGFVARLYRWMWLGRVTSPTPDLPDSALIFAAHYNGMIDAATYGSQLGPFTGVVSVQWQKNAIGRWLLPGIAVKRAKDRAPGFSNTASFRAMLAFLRQGGRLLFFPEGTSRLGSERLPVQGGTLLLLRMLRANPASPNSAVGSSRRWEETKTENEGAALKLTPDAVSYPKSAPSFEASQLSVPIYFAAAHYHDPTRWRSAVSLGWIGPLTLPASSVQDEHWVTENLLAAQTLAYALPAPPPRRFVWLGALLAFPYLPWWALTDWLARRTADEDNVIALWKFIFGVPLTLIAFVTYAWLAPKVGLSWCVALASLTGGWLCWSR